jgi:hypothetical protein
LVLSLLVPMTACATPPPETARTLTIPSSAPAIASAPAPSGSAAASASAREAPPAPIDLPPIACTLRGKSWLGPTLVRFRSGAPAFARIDRGSDPAVLLGGATPAFAVLDLDAGGVRVRGAIEAADVTLHPARARLIADVLVPMAWASLAWEGTKDGAVLASFAIDARVRGIAPRASYSGPCADFALEATFEPLDAVGGRGLDKPMMLKTKRAIGVAADDSGRASITLTVDGDDDADVVVLARRGTKSRIAWRGSEQMVVGWVATSDLRTPPANLYGVGGLGIGSGTGVTSVGTRRKCAHEVLLVAEAAGELRTVGRIKPDVLIDQQITRNDDLVVVAFPKASLRAAPGAALLVRKNELADCATIDTPVVGFGP